LRSPSQESLFRLVSAEYQIPSPVYIQRYQLLTVKKEIGNKLNIGNIENCNEPDQDILNIYYDSTLYLSPAYNNNKLPITQVSLL
jgi:hypothetical protein